MRRVAALIAVANLMGVVASFVASAGADTLAFGPEELIQADGQTLVVPGYSVPHFADWNGDGLFDLIVGEGGGGHDNAGKVRVYLNQGVAGAPSFASFDYLRVGGAVLDANDCGCGCLGAFPYLVDLNGDTKKDLLIGQTYGQVMAYENIGTDDAPLFNRGEQLKAGPWGAKAPLYAGARATIAVADWNNNGTQDLVLGSYDGRIHVFANQGTDVVPDYAAEMLVLAGAGYLEVPTGRSSPVVVDLDGDGCKDLLVGNTAGQILFYRNEGGDAAPVFSTYALVTAGGVPIDLAGDARSRPTLVDWTGDGRLDLVVGSGDGRLRLFQSVPEPGTILLLVAAGASVLVARRVRRRHVHTSVDMAPSA